MARLESRVDLMHVPSPGVVIDRLRSMLKIPAGCACLDPCCGTGEALKSLAPTGSRYGVELDVDRAIKARRNLSEVLAISIQEAHISNGSFGLMLLNPPYDDSVEGRLESLFVDRCHRYLAPGGLMILIIGEGTFGSVAGTLRQQFDVEAHWRFPDGWYDGPRLAYKQTVLIARRRSSPAEARSAATFWEDDLKMGRLEPMPEEIETPLSVPIGKEPRLFVSTRPSPVEMEKLLSSSDLQRTMDVPPRLGCGQPPMVLKQGHVSLTLASGIVDGVYGAGPSRHVAKGMVIRKARKSVETDTTDSGKSAIIVKTVDSFCIQVRTIDGAGTIRTLSTAPAIIKDEEEADDSQGQQG